MSSEKKLDTEKMPAQSAQKPDEVYLPKEEVDTMPIAPVTQRESAEGDAVTEAEIHTKPLDPLPDELRATLFTPSNNQKDKVPPTIRFAQRCHVGAVRNRNEDSSYVFQSDTGGQIPMQPFGLYIVADGMGGHFAGHEASRRTSHLVASRILKDLYLPMLNSSDNNFEPVHEIMYKAVQEANQEIYNPDPEKDMGTTLTIALILGKRLYLAHVGDSRAYLLKDDELELLSVDHSYVRRLLDAGQLTTEQAAVHEQRHILYRAVGQGGELETDLSTRSLPNQGKILICSDGLWGMISHERLVEIMSNEATLHEKLDEMVALAMEAGGDDNITGVIVDFSY